MMNLFKRHFSFATLVLAEHNGLSLSKSTLKILSASFKLNDETHLLLKGNTSPQLIEQVKNVSGNQITKIITTQSTEIAEDLGYLIKKLISSSGYKNVVGATTSLGKDVIPRVAGYFSSQPITDIIEISAPNTYIRPTYAGNAMTKVTTSQQINFLTFRPSSFQEPSQAAGNPSIEEASHSETVKTSIVSQESSDSSKPQLTTARIVVSGGRGVKSKENFSLINQLADAFGQAAVGASRAAVDAGYCPNDLQVGQTGKVVAPELYIAVGISGAVQHLAGMKDSKVIVAINTKPDEPIFELANYGLEADLFKAVPELTAKIRKLKGL